MSLQGVTMTRLDIYLVSSLFQRMVQVSYLGSPPTQTIGNYWLPKLGIRNLSPHLRNSAILRTTKSFAELRTKKSCGTAIADLQNLTSATLCSLLPIPLLSGTFSSAQDCLVLWKPKTCLKGTVVQDYFLPLIFFHEPRPDSTVNDMLKIGKMKLSSCGFEVADIRKNCDCGFAELLLRSNIALKSCGIAIAEVFPSSCGIAIADSKKSCACPPLLATAVN
jgi:hypothetical protein